MTIIIVIWIITFICSLDIFFDISITPNQLYEVTSLNMFGCILLWLFLIIIDPLLFMGRFIYFIFHVGRKE